MRSAVVNLFKEVNSNPFEVPKEYLISPKKRERFLKGPISMPWLYKVMALGGKAIHVSIEICHWAGIKDSDEIKLSVSRLRTAQISRYACYRALKRLEGAGLIIVNRKPGRSPIIKILNYEKVFSKKPHNIT